MLTLLHAAGVFLVRQFMVIVTDRRMQTLTLAVAALKGRCSANYGLVMAGSTPDFLPPFFLYTALQKEFAEGIALSEITG